MKTALIGLAAAAVFYLGYSMSFVTEKLTAETDRWHAELDRIHQRIDELPALARTSATEGVKGAARQLDKEIVGAPAEMGKAAVNGTTGTIVKGCKDLVAEAKRVPKHAKTFVDRISGGAIRL
jgi:hypothetical protein